MLKFFHSIFRNPFVWGAFILALLLIFSLILRQHNFNKVTGAQNLEATYHILLTVTALDESPVANHWYLPTISLGRELDKYIPWGATVPTKTGDYIYTSFTSPGFLAPYLWFKFFHIEPSVKNLAHFNFFLGSLSAFTLFFLLADLLQVNGHSKLTSVHGALVSTTIGVFSREALQSHGVSYWSHSLYQPILIFSLFIFFKYLTSESKESRSLYAVAIVAGAFFGSLTEWTGYIFNAGLILLLWLGKNDSTSSKRLAIGIFIATSIAGSLTLIHYGLAVGFEPALKAFLRRFLARNNSAGSIVGLVQGYGLSYGLFILTTVSALAFSYFRKQETELCHGTTFLIFIAACIPLFENILMLQHATQFSFDRLKFIFPSSIILAFTFARFHTKGRSILLLLVLMSCFQGYKSYKMDLENYSAWSSIDSGNRKLASQISEKVDVSCTVFSSNLGVRGYANLLFHRGIYEHKSIQDTSELIQKRNACSSVYLEGNWVFPDLPKYTKATVMRNDGSTATIASEPIK